MSKKVLKWLIADIIIAVAVTFLVIWLGNAASNIVDNETARTVIFYVKTALWIVIDLIVLFWFLLYWWSDRKWTNIKNKFKKTKEK